MRKAGLRARGRRLVQLLLSRRQDHVQSESLTEAERSLRHIWRYLTVTSGIRCPPKRKRPTVLVLQMGKVASLAIHEALSKSGRVNAFHSHGLSVPNQERRVGHLLKSEFTFLLSSHQLRYHVQNVALGLLVRWYQTHGRYRGERLKVVTLTRDPVTYYISSFIQRRMSVVPNVQTWHRARLGVAPGADVDVAQAVREFALELAAIIAESGVESSDLPVEMARRRWPDHPVVADEVKICLRPLTWLDAEITQIFGLDILSQPELAQRGWVIVQNDWVEILALRFEQLNRLIPKMAEFAGLAELVLPNRNVTSRKEGAAAYQSAIQAAFETPTGQACIDALRASAYARACGYERPTSREAALAIS